MSLFGDFGPSYLGMPSGSRAPPYDTDEELPEQTTTNPTLPGGELIFTPNPNTDYLFLWSGDVNCSVTSTQLQSDVTVNGVSIFTVLPSYVMRETSSPPDYVTMGGLFRYQAGGSTSLTSFTHLARHTANPGTIKLKNSRLTYLEMGPDDEYAESLARQTVASGTSNTQSTIFTMNFTPPSSGDYTILCSFNGDLGAGTNIQLSFELTDGTTTTGNRSFRPTENSDRMPIVMTLALSSISGPKTINLKIQETGSGNHAVGVSEIRCFAIRNDRFANTRRANMVSTSSGSGTSYTSCVGSVLTFTPTAGFHLNMAYWRMGQSAASRTGYSKFVDDGTDINEHIAEPGTAVVGDTIAAFSHRLVEYTAVSKTLELQRKSEASTTAVQLQSGVISFDLTNL